MKRTIVATLCVLAFAISAASATTINVNLANLDGWKVTTKNSNTDPRAAVTEKLNYAGANGFSMSPGRSGSSDFAWAGVSYGDFGGLPLASITGLRIRNYGVEGDGSNWQPPTFIFWVYKAPDNPSKRNLTWVPWTNGNDRAPGQWNTYDATTTGTWKCSWIGTSYLSWAAVQTGIPSGVLMTDAQATAEGSFSGQAFNVASGSWINEENQYFSSARGVVDWIEIDFSNGSTYRYDFAEVVPEPGSLVALGTGLVGLMGLVRRRRS